MTVHIVFRIDHAYEDLHGTNFNYSTVVAVCGSADAAKKKIKELHQIPQEKQDYYFDEYEVIDG